MGEMDGFWQIYSLPADGVGGLNGFLKGEYWMANFCWWSLYVILSVETQEELVGFVYDLLRCCMGNLSWLIESVDLKGECRVLFQPSPGSKPL